MEFLDKTLCEKSEKFQVRENCFFDKAPMVIKKVLEQLDCKSLKIIFSAKIKPFVAFMKKYPSAFKDICATIRYEESIGIEVVVPWGLPSRDSTEYKLIQLMVHPNDTVGKLRQCLYVAFDLSVDYRLELFYARKRLQSHKTIAEQNIKSCATISTILVQK